MDDILLISKIQKELNKRLQHIGDSILAGGVDTMEKYRYLVGQAHAIQLTLQDISNPLKEHPLNLVVFVVVIFLFYLLVEYHPSSLLTV